VSRCDVPGLQITTRNARFQQWQALLGNRNKRHQTGQFLVHGVRPISLAVERGWPIGTLIYDAERRLSQWALDLLEAADAERVAMSADLIAELGDKTEAPPEVVAVAAIPADDLTRVTVGADFLGVLLDRPTSPGNVGSTIRSADALGAHGVIVTGHAADAYDPRSVRASTGSLFALPTVRVPSAREVTAWLDDLDRVRRRPRLIGADEGGGVNVFDADLTGAVLLLVGNETSGLSAAWRGLCDQMVSIPMTGSASSLNAANAATVVLYEARRQRITS
jgi:TrmH family RNA methyltransferase